MSEFYFYRANDELAAALRAHAAEKKAWFADVLDPFNAEHPDNPPLWSTFAGRQTCVGFEDGAPREDPPAGLSRAQNRSALKPKRGKAGEGWEADRKRLQDTCPQLSDVFERFGCRTVDPPGWYVRTEWDEADEVRMVLGVHSEEEAERVARYLNALEPECTCEYPYPAEIWMGHHPNCELERSGAAVPRG